MDRRTLLAVVLSVIVITIGFSIQSLLFPPPEIIPTDQPGQTAPRVTQGTPGAPDAPATQAVAAPAGTVVAVETDGISASNATYESDLIRVTMDPAGASVVSFELLEHMDGDSPVDMVFRGADDQRAMTLHFGDHRAPVVTELFELTQIGANTFEFRRDFAIAGQENSEFTVIRRYRFQPGEYMFQHDVEIRNRNPGAFIPLNFDGIAYTIGYGPQIGPIFEQLDQRNEFRRFLALQGGKRQNYNRVSANNPQITTERITWAAIAGKYFALIAVTDNRELTAVLAREPRQGLAEGAQLYLTRPVIRASGVEDRFQYYVGPKTPEILGRYENASDNAWGRAGLTFNQVQESRVLFGWLENILKWVLQLIVRFVPNYGIAIIILTVLVKAALYPLTHKSYESNARMQAVQPKMAEIRERHKDNQQRQNEEMAKLYKKEGVNPLGGCLPMLAQFPFFLAMYGLFNNHFDLRGAVFIPGWISDLSAPDVLVGFGDFTLPLLGWTALRGLPIIFVGTQLLSTKFTQTPAANQSSAQMKFMQFGLPLVFFFILYNVPSGLLVYWIFSNVLTVGQQYYYNQTRKNQPPPAPGTGKSGPARLGPNKSGPNKSGPTKSGPTKSGPSKSGPSRTGPRKRS